MGERLSVSWRRCSGCWVESIAGRGVWCEVRVVRAYDPVANQEEQCFFAGETGIEFVGKPMEVLQGA